MRIYKKPEHMTEEDIRQLEGIIAVETYIVLKQIASSQRAFDDAKGAIEIYTDYLNRCFTLSKLEGLILKGADSFYYLVLRDKTKNTDFFNALEEVRE